MPLAAVMQVATGPTSGIAHPTAIRRATLTTWTNRPPTWSLRRDWKAMSHADLEATLRGINGRHASPKQRPMALTTVQHQIDPGVNHLVTQGAFCCLLGQGLQHRTRQHDLATAFRAHSGTAPIKACGTAHSPIAPAQSQQRLAVYHQSTLKMLAIEPMKQGQQGEQCQRQDPASAPASCRGQSDSSLL